MIQFNELRLSLDKRKLIIDVSIEDVEELLNMSIQSISVATLNDIIDIGDLHVPVGTEVYNKYDNTFLDEINDEGGKRVKLVVLKPVIDTAKNNLYFVYVIVDTSEYSELLTSKYNCDGIAVGVAYDKQYLYNTLISEIREIGEDCSIPRNLIDSFLKVNAIDTFVRTGNYTLAAKYWNKFYANTTVIKPHFKPCGCYGRSR